ncbi:MAG: zinc-binding dehydrogenase, partial [Phycisphaerales bacterium]|nr:zinc-binding dehydrogenase [Phycisphaerales bacterium]
FRHRLMVWDAVLIAAGIYVIWYLIAGGDDLQDRYVFPEPMDVVVGWMLIALVLEVARRATGWIMPAVAIAFLLYGFHGDWLPPPWRHQGYDAERLIPHLTITLEGIFGTAVDVSASLIVLFTIYGAILQASGAGKFFVDFSFALTGGKPVDVVLEATGHPPSITDALPVLKREGVLVVAGIHAAPLSLPLTVFVRNRHQLRASHGSEPRTWERVIALLAREPEAYRPMITHRLPLDRGLEGFELARQRAASKVILIP